MNTSSHYHWFNSYAETFLGEDKDTNNHIILKRDHSLRVAKHTRKIAHSLEHSTADLVLAELCGLYHDIARFEQYSQYKTFQDSVSVDHGEFGANLFSSLDTPNIKSHGHEEIISYAIRFHNKREIPKTSGRQTHFTKIVRDADKLDIFKVLIDEFTSENSSLKMNLPDLDTCSSEIISAIYSRSQVSYSMRRSVNDMKLVMLNWLFDLSFSYSLEYVVKKNYIEQIGELLPKSREILEIIDFVKAEVMKELQLRREA